MCNIIPFPLRCRAPDAARCLYTLGPLLRLSRRRWSLAVDGRAVVLKPMELILGPRSDEFVATLWRLCRVKVSELSAEQWQAILTHLQLHELLADQKAREAARPTCVGRSGGDE